MTLDTTEFFRMLAEFSSFPGSFITLIILVIMITKYSMTNMKIESTK